MKKTVLLLVLSLVTAFSFGQSKKIAPESTVQFKIKNAGLTVDGNFKGLEGTINFNSNELTTSTFNVSISSQTVNTNNSGRDGHLKKKEYFDVATYPKINYKPGIIQNL